MNTEKHGRGAWSQAWRMLDTFARLGVHAFDVTLTDIEGCKRGYRPAMNLERLRSWLPTAIESAAQHQHNVIVRPKRTTAELVQLDDLSEAGLERVRSVAFLVLATSAGNYQAWIAVRESAPDLARRLRQGIGADRCASGATRVAGSINFKLKYAPNFPLVALLHVAPQCTVTQTQLQGLGLVNITEACLSKPAHVGSGWQARRWPSYARCLQNAPCAHQSNRPDVSRADFTFCLLAIDWGWSPEETLERLLMESDKARRNGAAYAQLTVQRAAAAIHRRSLSDREVCGKNEAR